MSGKLSNQPRPSNCIQTLESNLKSVIPELRKRQIVGLIEPVNTYSVPGYLLSDFNEGS